MQPVPRGVDAAKWIYGRITKANYPEIANIYQEGIETGKATFEVKVPTWEQWTTKFLPFGRITVEKNGRVIGWGALAPTSSRSAYKGVAEISIYIAKAHASKGVGKAIMEKLIFVSELNNCWTLQSSMMPANKASIALHLKCGFRQIGYREKIGYLNGKWEDNVLFERRSTKVGL